MKRNASNLKKLTKQQEAEICAKYSKECSSTILSKIYSVDPGTIRNILRRNNSKVLARSDYKSIPEHLEKSIIDQYKSGLSCKKISEKYKIDAGCIRRLLIQTNTKLRTQKEANTRYIFNHKFFNIINTEAKAYFLGFLLADGYVTEKSIVLDLKINDKHILEAFKEYIEGTNMIREYYKPPSLFAKKGTHICRLFLLSNEMAKNLNKLGLHRNKTYDIIIPNIREDLERHFWRGVLDGDGHISFYNSKSKTKLASGVFKYYHQKVLEVGICGHTNTMKAFATFLEKNNIETPGIRPDHSIYRVRVRTKDCPKFLNLIYTDSDPKLCLKRKYAKYQEYLEYKKVNGKDKEQF